MRCKGWTSAAWTLLRYHALVAKHTIHHLTQSPKGAHPATQATIAYYRASIDVLQAVAQIAEEVSLERYRETWGHSR